MNEFRHNVTPDAAGDPLERLIEAFVDQSVPVGPDAATQRRLIAAMRALDASNDDCLVERRADGQGSSASSAPQARRWFASAVGQFVALAAAILVVVGAAFMFRTPDELATNPPVTNPDAMIAQADPAVPAPTTADARIAEELAALAEALSARDGRLANPQAVQKMLAELLRDRPEMANSEAWRFAHARLTSALEQPKVLTLGVGLLGTLPWTTYGRF
jgi:hypothetical protein